MSSKMCPVCQAQSRDGYLCHHCTRRLVRDLAEVPWLWLETKRTAVGMARLFGHVGGRGAEVPMPVNEAASDVATRVLDGVGIRTGITGWVRVTVKDLGAPWPARSITGMCTHLAEHASDLRKHEAISELVADVRDWTDAMVQVINRPTIRRIPVGPCPLIHDDGTPCSGRIWATFPEHSSAYSACDTCADLDGDVDAYTSASQCHGIWGCTQWAALGSLIQARKAEVARQRKLAESLTRGTGRAS